VVGTWQHSPRIFVCAVTNNYLDAGVEVLNEAIDAVHSRVPAVNWTYAHVTIAPSTITITEHDVSVLLLFLFCPFYDVD
jgi:hypothetical protein